MTTLGKPHRPGSFEGSSSLWRRVTTTAWMLPMSKTIRGWGIIVNADRTGRGRIRRKNEIFCRSNLQVGLGLEAFLHGHCPSILPTSFFSLMLPFPVSAHCWLLGLFCMRHGKARAEAPFPKPAQNLSGLAFIYFFDVPWAHAFSDPRGWHASPQDAPFTPSKHRSGCDLSRRKRWVAALE